MRTTRIALLVLLVVSLGLLVTAIRWSPDRDDEGRERSELSVVVIGIDGLDWFMVSKLIEAGKLNTIERLIQSGLSAEVAADRPVIPDVGWTMLLTGRTLTEDEISRVSGPGRERLRGAPPRIGRVVTEWGGTSVTVGAPTTWPSDEAGGVVVAPCSVPEQIHGAGLSPTLLAGAESQTSEAGLSEMVSEIVERNEADYLEGFEREILAGGAPVDREWADAVAAARWAFLSDRISLDVASKLLAEREPDVLFVQFGGLDVVSHRFLAFARPEFFDGRIPEAAIEHYSGVLANYYEFMDSAITRLSRLTDSKTILMVCSVHGIHPAAEAVGIFAGHDMGPPGVLIVDGVNVTPTPRPLAVTTLDLAPTILALLGLPIPSDLEGRLLVEATPLGFLDTHAPRYVTSAEPAVQDTPPEHGADTQELIARRLELVGQGLGLTSARP